MRHFKSIHTAASVGVLLAPLATLAQPQTGSVTTRPLAQQAPALGLPLLAILAVALLAIAVYRLWRANRGPILGLGFVVTMTLLAGIGYALVMVQTITIAGAACGNPTVSAFNAFSQTRLKSACVNPIQIVDIQSPCDGGTECTVSPNAVSCVGSAASDGTECTIGLILGDGNTCELPICP